MSEQSSFVVWTDDTSEDGEAVGVKGALPNMKKGLARSSKNMAVVASEVMSDNLRNFLAAIEGSVIDGQPTDSNFDIEQIELNLVVNANGGVELLGKLSAGAKASMKLVLKRKRAK